MMESSPLLHTKISFQNDRSNALEKLEEYFRRKSCMSCYNLRPLTHAEIIASQDLSASVVHLCTLIENRWTTEEIAPYHGHELCPSQSVGDIWRDYSFTAPIETRLTNERERYARRDLPDSQRKEPCTKCDCQGRISCDECEGCGYLKCLECREQGQIECCRNQACKKCLGQRAYICSLCSGRGQSDCSSCHGCGEFACPQCKGCRFVRIWTCLHVRWYNDSSTISYQPEGQCQLPNSMIENSSEKVTSFVYDTVCSSMEEMLEKYVGISKELREKIKEEFRNKHGRKVGRMIRLRCVVQRLKVKEFQYKINGKKNCDRVKQI